MPRKTTTTVARAVADDFSLSVRAFHDDLDAAGKSAATKIAYAKATDQLEAYLRGTDGPLAVAGIGPEHIRGFLIDLRARTTKYGGPTSETTVSQRYRSLQQFFKFLVHEGVITDSPIRTVSAPKIVLNPPPVVTIDEFRQLLKTCSGTSFAERRDTAILSLFYDSGMRRAELAGIKLSDLDLDQRDVTVTGKGRRSRTVRYGPDMSRTLTRYLRERAKHLYADSDALWLGQDGPLTVYGVEQIVQRRAEAAGLPHIHPHLFRHAFADSYLSTGGNEGDLMKHVGWRSRQMVDRYAASVAEERARRNFETHSPLARLRRG